MDYKVSVIIPLYKAGEYIINNVDLLLNQTLRELEVVIVNDCTPDDSMDKCRERYGANERVQLIDQPENMGPGRARNAGIKAARGEYIAFFDSDDGVLPDSYEKMYKGAAENDADVLHTTGAIFPLVKNPPVNLLDVDKEDLVHLPLDRSDLATTVRLAPSDPIERYLNWKNEWYHWNVWSKLYRRTFLLENSLCFSDMRVGEDQLFCLGVLLFAPRYVQFPGEFYIYRISGDSLSRGKSRMPTLLKAIEGIIYSEPVIKGYMEIIPAFKAHPEYIGDCFDFVADCLENIFIRPAFQEMGYDEVDKDGSVRALFEKHYGSKAGYVYYAFMEQHKNYEPVEDLMKLFSDIDHLKENAQRIKEGNISVK